MPNKGEMDTELDLETGGSGSIVFQAAPARKPFLAVSKVNAKGNPVLFDGHQSYIVPGSAPEVAEIRRLIQRIPGKISLHLKNGVYTMKAWQKTGLLGRPGQ